MVYADILLILADNDCHVRLLWVSQLKKVYLPHKMRPCDQITMSRSHSQNPRQLQLLYKFALSRDSRSTFSGSY